MKNAGKLLIIVGSALALAVVPRGRSARRGAADDVARVSEWNVENVKSHCDLLAERARKIFYV